MHSRSTPLPRRSMAESMRRPRFADLPLQPGDPPMSAWGVWGPSDQLGCLNNLTPERTVAASRLVENGISIGLNWEMHQMNVPPFYRTKLKHEIFRIGDHINVVVSSCNAYTTLTYLARTTRSSSTRRQAHNGTPFGIGAFQTVASTTV